MLYDISEPEFLRIPHSNESIFNFGEEEKQYN